MYYIPHVGAVGARGIIDATDAVADDGCIFEGGQVAEILVGFSVALTNNFCGFVIVQSPNYLPGIIIIYFAHVEG